jgi:hypothetical protein
VGALLKKNAAPGSLGAALSFILGTKPLSALIGLRARVILRGIEGGLALEVVGGVVEAKFGRVILCPDRWKHVAISPCPAVHALPVALGRISGFIPADRPQLYRAAAAILRWVPRDLTIWDRAVGGFSLEVVGANRFPRTRDIGLLGHAWLLPH